MPTVLVVDDEANIRELVSLYLAAAGYSVATASNGAEALERFRAGPPDLVILDIMLPGAHGSEVCAAIRAESDVPVIMLTARAADLDKVVLLEAGADDYVVKPFSPPELVARVRAVLRRSGRAGPTDSLAGGPPPVTRPGDLRVGALAISPEAREVTVDGKSVLLTAREFDLLLAMAASPGVVFSRRQLLEVATGFDDFFHERGIDVHIRHLREKLGDEAAEPRFIETVRGVGYRVRKVER
ncbi:MAG: response regulator transcription factor [Thermoleophilia bacterium]|nr:response regulator transcription factor [Thermoleophilia bacterium]